MLEPKRVKYRKVQKGRRRGTAHRGSTLAFGDFGLKALGRGWMSAREIEAARVALTRYLKRGGKVWIRIFPDKPLTKKPLETRMGKGKGAPEMWVAVIQPGRILFEMEGVERSLARERRWLVARLRGDAVEFLALLGRGGGCGAERQESCSQDDARASGRLHDRSLERSECTTVIIVQDQGRWATVIVRDSGAR